MATGGEARTYHLNAVERFVGSTAALVTLGWIGIDQMVRMPDAPERILGGTLIVLAAYVWWLLVYRLQLRVTPSQLIVRNVFRTREVALEDIKDVRPAYEGTKVHLTNGKHVTVLALQRWNVSLWLDRETRADRVAEEILSRRDKLRREHDWN